jgi:hypothetical protein
MANSHATVAHFRAAERVSREGGEDARGEKVDPADPVYVRSLGELVRIADALGIADDVVLWPHLMALIDDGEIAIATVQ